MIEIGVHLRKLSQN